MTRSRDIADQQKNAGGAVAPFVGAKNFVANGGFDFWQRGTTFASPLPAYTADRFAATASAGGTTWSVSRVASFLTGSQYALRVQRTSGQTGTPTFFLGVGFETADVIKLQGKTVTWSFFVQAGSNYSPSGSSLGVTFYTGTGTDLGPFVGHPGEVAQINTSQTISTTGTRYSYTFTIPTNATSARFNLAMPPTGTAGANDYYDITNMQLEIGSVATPFSRAGGSIGGELALCQRYYWRSTQGGTYSSYAMGTASSTTIGYIPMPNPVPMRVNPTSIDYANLELADLAGNSFQISSIAISYAGAYNSTIAATTAGVLVVVRPYVLRNNNNTAGYLGFSAEL